MSPLSSGGIGTFIVVSAPSKCCPLSLGDAVLLSPGVDDSDVVVRRWL